ncbi:MAG: hypothetical protein KAS62_01605 [Candidatus Delongbacteria bacterium]|nr:hypothetical protein [Candidatus Delongbacteria bacterium]
MRIKPFDLRATLLIIITLSLLSACDRDQDKEVAVVDAEMTLYPPEGETTTIFNFDAKTTFEAASSEIPIFVRWDWENDGIWDLSYSSKSTYTHRYYAPGNYEVLMEASNIFGYKDSILLPINVAQGYSSPRANFTVTPDSANILTKFIFDASSTKDDEDSLNTLQFRWDFNGDQIWDTEFSNNPTIEKQYDVPSEYDVKLEVIDPSELADTTTVLLIANLFDDRIHAIFTFVCNHCTIEDTIQFDASQSYHDDGKELKYSWDFGNNGIWDFEKIQETKVSGIIPKTGANLVRLKVMDEEGMMMDYVDTVHLFGINSAPIARLAISSHVGNPQSEFFLHAKASSDRDESILDLHYCWDLDNDGQWDEQFDKQWEINFTLPTVGKHPIKLGVKDSGDKWSIVSDTIEIFEGNHETGVILDRRGQYGGDMYSTVRIGDQWWMQENLRFYDTYMKPPIYPNFYKNDPESFTEYGNMYFTWDLNHVNGICPEGWRVPTKDDFNTLFAQFEEDLTSQILYGGASEFHIKLGGWIEMRTVSKGRPFMTHLWTSDTNIQGNLPIGVFINSRPAETRFVYTNTHCAYYVRCIKK